MVVGGSLTRGVEVRLAPGVSVEDVKVGTFVTIHGERHHFFGVITDVALEAADQHFKARLDVAGPDADERSEDGGPSFLSRVLAGTAAYGTLQVLPTLVLSGQAEALLEGPTPAKTVPAHFSRVYAASEGDVQRVFGREDERHFHIGTPLDMEVKLCLDMEELIKRSNGVFGKSGTGKSFLTRLLLVGMLQRTGAATLIFDMHSEYGWQARDPERGGAVKGLKQLFGHRVAVFTLDEEHARRRRFQPDVVVRIGYEEVQAEDVELLAAFLNLTQNAQQAVARIARRYGRGWLQAFLELDAEGVAELARELNEHEGTLSALQRRLKRLERLPFLVPRGADPAPPAGPGPTPSAGPGHSLARILEYLDRGMHVVLEFGRYGRDLTAYLLVANLLTRRIHERYVQRMEEAEGQRGQEPRPLVIVIEEAHRFLTPTLAPLTVFGTIAREMRKYNVTLLVVDQRPSGIDTEVLSQLGTKLVCLLDDEKDVDAVLAGAPGARELRAVLARLEGRQQALVFGHAVPMPVVVRVRTYGPEAYRELAPDAVLSREERARRFEAELLGTEPPEP